MSQFRSICSLRDVCWLYLWESLFILAQQPPVGQGLLAHEVSTSHTTTHHIRYMACVLCAVQSTAHNTLDEWSGRRRNLRTHNTHNRQNTMPPVGFEPIISAGERPQTARPLGSAPLGEWDDVILKEQHSTLIPYHQPVHFHSIWPYKVIPYITALHTM